jgi:hypothetical protein
VSAGAGTAAFFRHCAEATHGLGRELTEGELAEIYRQRIDCVPVPMDASGRVVDYSRTFHTRVGTSALTVRVWSENEAGFDEEVRTYELTQALQKILAGEAAEENA